MTPDALRVGGPNERENMKNWLQEVRGYNGGQTPIQPGHHRHLPLLQHTHTHIPLKQSTIKITLQEHIFDTDVTTGD